MSFSFKKKVFLQLSTIIINSFFLILLIASHAISDTGFPKTGITSKYSGSPYANEQNVFPYKGQCTWYAYGRVLELADSGYLDSSVKNQFIQAFSGKTGRHARYWPDFLGGTWISTNSESLPYSYRKKGLIAVWKFGSYGHVGFVEEVSNDKKRYRLSDFNRSVNESYQDRWYNFSGSSDRLGRVYPYFYELKLKDNPTGYAKISNGIYITPSTVVLNKTFNITFTLKEVNGQSITYEKIAVAVHRSNNNNSILFDAAMYNNVRIQANETFTKTVSTKIYNSPSGEYIAIVKGYKNGGWFHFETTGSGKNEKHFTVIEDDNGGGNTNCPNGQIQDCDNKCVNESTANSWLGDGYCDDGSYGMNLYCSKFSYDKGDCN